MKCLFWNIRGIANSPLRLALKNLILTHKPNFIFIAEPWMFFEHLPRNWFHRLHFKLFALNQRHDRIPNLWCLCSNHLNPKIISVDNQQISFTFIENNETLAILAIYASTNQPLGDNFGRNFKTYKTNLIYLGVLLGILTL